jgi:hypothetical protein
LENAEFHVMDAADMTAFPDQNRDVANLPGSEPLIFGVLL